jgi:phosphoribosylanthranilate isomerase
VDATDQGGRPYLRAARIPLGDGARDFDLVKYAQDFSQAQAILLDAHVDGYGGGGKHSIGHCFLQTSTLTSS